MTCNQCLYWVDSRAPVCVRFPRWVPHEASAQACGEFKQKPQAERDADAVEAAKDGDMVPVEDITATNRVLADRKRRKGKK